MERELFYDELQTINRIKKPELEQQARDNIKNGEEDTSIASRYQREREEGDPFDDIVRL